MSDSEAIEARGAADGINPTFGEWKKEFEIEPVSYANPGAARTAFKQAVRATLSNKFVFVGELSFTATFYLDEQKMLETPAYGDLDNYAKQLLDCFKGRGGLFIDDCQVQHLCVSWIDVSHRPRFEVKIKSRPDDFILEPLKLYEMPDGLFYPLSERVWTEAGVVEAPEGSVAVLASVLAEMTKAKKAMRHALRQEGAPQSRAFEIGKVVSPVLVGFHRSRVVASGYELVPQTTWAV
jgi:Holliday junction resolvase RusA-like endonuclease